MNIVAYLVTWGDPRPPPPEPVSDSDDEPDPHRGMRGGATRGMGGGATRGGGGPSSAAAAAQRIVDSDDDMTVDLVNSITASELNFAFKSVSTGVVTPLQNVVMSDGVKSTLASILPTSRTLKPYKRSNTDARMLQLHTVLKGEQTFGSCGDFSSLGHREVAGGVAVVMTAEQLACISGKWLETNATAEWLWASDHVFQPHGVLTQSTDKIRYNKRVRWDLEHNAWKNMVFDPSISEPPPGAGPTQIINSTAVSSLSAGFSTLPTGSVTKQITARQILRVIPIVTSASTVVYTDVAANECCVCFDSDCEMCTNVCGHQVCGICAPRLQKCPLCRAPWTSLPSPDPTPPPAPVFACANHKIGAVLFDIVSPLLIRGTNVEAKLADIMNRWETATNEEIADFKLCIKKLCRINPVEDMSGIRHTRGDCLMCYTPTAKKIFVHQDVQSRQLKLFLVDMSNPSPYTGFDMSKLYCVRQMKSAMYNVTGNAKRMRSPSNLPFVRNGHISHHQCDNCLTTGHATFYQDVTNDIDLCVSCYATLRWVEPCYRWDGMSASISETASALAGDSDASVHDEEIEEFLKAQLAPSPIVAPRKIPKTHHGKYHFAPGMRIEEWGQHLDEIGTEFLQCKSSLCENRTDPVADQGQVTKILTSLEATSYNDFVVHTDIGMTASIRQSLIAHMDSKHRESGSKVDEFGGVDMRLNIQSKHNRVELLDILKNTLDATGASATPEQCKEIDVFVKNITTLLPESDFDLILRRSEPPPAVLKNDPLQNSDETPDPGLCIQFHKDESKFTMAIPLNTSGDGCEGGRVVYVTTTGFKMPERNLDSLTIHDNTIAHGITTHSKGVRYGMFLLSRQDEVVER